MTTSAEDEPLALVGGGLVCAVGTNLATGLAAIAANVCRLRTVVDPSVQPEPFVVATSQARGAMSAGRHFVGMLVEAVDELLTGQCPTSMERVATFIGWPDPARPGAPPRPTAAQLVDLLGPRATGIVALPRVQCLTGETAGARALARAAHELRDDPGLDACLVAAVDSWLDPGALQWLARRCPLRRPATTDGFAPGEAAAAVWLTRARRTDAGMRLLGIGTSPAPLVRHEASGLRVAIGHALALAGLDIEGIDHLVADSGTDPRNPLYWGLTLSNTYAAPWHGATWTPASSIGHVGAATGLVEALLAAHLLNRHEQGGASLCVVGSGEGRELAVVLGAPRGASASQEDEIPWAM